MPKRARIDRAVDRQPAVRRKNIKKRNKKRKRLFYLALSMIVISALVISSLTIFFKIEKILVIGQTPYEDEYIALNSGVKIGDNLFRLDKFKVAKDMQDQNPYIEKATINRKLPGTLVINLVQAKKLCYYNSPGGYVTLSDKGKILEITEEKPELPLLRGSGIIKNQPGSFAEFKDEIAKDVFMAINEVAVQYNIQESLTEINVTKMHNLILEYKGNIILELGNSDELQRKIALFLEIMSGHDDKDKAVVKVSDTTNRGASYLLLTKEDWDAKKVLIYEDEIAQEQRLEEETK